MRSRWSRAGACHDPRSRKQHVDACVGARRRTLLAAVVARPLSGGCRPGRSARQPSLSPADHSGAPRALRDW